MRRPTVYRGVLLGLLIPACAQPSSEPDPPPPAASECIEDPFVDAARVMVERYAEAIADRTGAAPSLADYAKPGASCTAIGLLPDLDGDGVEDLEVTEGCSWGSYASLHVIYFSNHGCARFADDIIDGELSLAEDTHDGVRDLEATVSNGCAGNDFVWTRYSWDGAEYQVADTATCALCPDGDGPGPNANTHPRCATGS